MECGIIWVKVLVGSIFRKGFRVFELEEFKSRI